MPVISAACVAEIGLQMERAFRSDRLTEIGAALGSLAARGVFEDPALYAGASEDRYRRRLLWRDPAGRFVVIAMTWAPRQGSDLHDHDGFFGAELVVHGTMRERCYALADRLPGGLHQFIPGQEVLHAAHAVSTISPPLEYHEFANAGTVVAHTIHVYSGELARCRRYLREGTGWWRSSEVDLRYDES